jgi:hypothetical protein
MLTVANGLTSVPSPLKLIPSTMAFGTATPATMFHPCAANRYELFSVLTLQVSGASAARAVPDVPRAIAATRLTNAQAKHKQLVVFLSSFVFIVVVSFCLSFFLFWPSLAPHS